MTGQYFLSEIIKKRHSCRSYRDAHIDEPAKNIIESLCARSTRGLCNEEAGFYLVEKDQKLMNGDKLGDYGIFKNPCNFIIGKIKHSPLAFESYGYLMERIVLKATELDLGTCWLGYFNKQYFPEIKLNSDEIFPAAVIIGYPGKKQTVRERLMRFAAGAGKRKNPDELFFLDNALTPLNSDSAGGEYSLPLELLRLAPSSGNTRPWRIVRERDKNTFHFFKKIIKNAYEKKKLHNIDLGIAMYHFEAGVKENHLSGEWQRIAPVPKIELDSTDYIVSWLGDTEKQKLGS